MPQIEVDSLDKRFRVSKKSEDLIGSIKGLFSREYKDVDAVKNLSFSIEAGESIGFLGPNGAGKTTTIKLLTGLIYPTGGTVEVLGYRPWERKNEFKRQISLVMGNKFQLWWDLPAVESFLIQKKIYDVSNEEYTRRMNTLCEILNVAHLTHIPVRNLSLGERMKMEIITALIHKPQILFLDEPTIGLDYSSQKSIRTFLQNVNQLEGTTIMITSHYMDDIEAVCDRLIMISDGQLIYDGTKAQLADRYDKEVVISLRFSLPIGQDVLRNYGDILYYSSENCRLIVSKNKYIEVMHILLGYNQIKDINVNSLPLESIVEKCYMKRNMLI